MNALIVSSDDHRFKNCARFVSLAECLGVTAEFCEVRDGASLVDLIESKCLGQCALVLDVDGLAKICQPPHVGRIAAAVQSGTASILLLVAEASSQGDGFLQVLTDCLVSGSAPLPHVECVLFPHGGRSFSKQLCGQSYRTANGTGIGLVLSHKAETTTVMSLDGDPSFVRVKVGNGSLFVWSTTEVFDVDRPLSAEVEFEAALDRYIPAIIYLRHTFGDRVWGNTAPRAGLVIDDPLLTRNYGCIDFSRLLSSARRNGYHVTLAFIPWNHWRTRWRQAQLFREFSDCFSICVHGCDHNDNEFGVDDYSELLRKCHLAELRLRDHGNRVGLRSERLMVFPQEKYSLSGIKAVADSGQFLAAICTACMPRNLVEPQLRGADLLLPAQDCFFGLPVFKRHYWHDMAPFAMALFLGKPAILVEHHEFFRDGPGGAENFARCLHAVSHDVRWQSLEDAVESTCSIRRTCNGRKEIRFFTNTFVFSEQNEGECGLVFIRRLPTDKEVICVTIGGCAVSYERSGEWLRFEYFCSGPELIEIQIGISTRSADLRQTRGLAYAASVALRRVLSEVRDSIAANYPALLQTTRRVVGK